jgi:hypothetical protein
LWIDVRTHIHTFLTRKISSRIANNANRRMSPAALWVNRCHRGTTCRRWRSYWESYTRQQDGRLNCSDQPEMTLQTVQYYSTDTFCLYGRKRRAGSTISWKIGWRIWNRSRRGTIEEVFFWCNWQQQWSSTLTGCSHSSILWQVANCQLDGPDYKPLCISSTECCEHHKERKHQLKRWIVHLVHI